jgi:hypothetical protein
LSDFLLLITGPPAGSPELVMTAHPGVSHHRRMRARRSWADAQKWPAPVFADDVRDAYHEWREHADGVADSYERWSAASRSERGLRFAAYAAALDREEIAARAYAESIVRLAQWLPSAAENHRPL